MSNINNFPDIIIPIYNAFDDVNLCIDSIRKHTDLEKVRVILINDKSTDDRILPYLKSQQEKNIILIDNEKNEGFSASVNKGIVYSERDVILLNSDTIVTKNWIKKITDCAYSEPEIGTVTPLSNSATLCSVPVFCQDNEIPKNVTIDKYAELIERCSLKKYPRITVAVGFCMFIKREVINIVGLFDADTFKKGYGEENDFCNRAEQYGYKHVMCDDTFIYHKGTVSFQSDEKLKLIKSHTEILNQRYSIQMRKNHEYCMNNPDQYIRDNIDIYLKLINKKKNILYFLHSDFHKEAIDNIGGTQLHVQDLALGLLNDYNVIVMARDGSHFRVTIYTGNEEIPFKFFIGKQLEYPMFTNKEQAEVIRNVLVGFNINLVHIHHTFGLSLDIYHIANSLKIPIMVTLHDYYYICPTIKLFNNKNNVCIDCENEEMCKNCLRAHYNIAETVNYLPKWRYECEKALTLCDKIITPSESAKSIFIKYYSDLKNKITVIEHGSDKNVKQNTDTKSDVIQSEKCKIHIESLFNNIESNQITGWAYLDGVNSKNSNIYIEIMNDQGKKEIFSTNKQERSDVAGEKVEFLFCGFQVNICKELLGVGKVKIRVIIENNGFFTNGMFYEYDIKHKVSNNNLNVAFIGGLNVAKGSEYAYNMIKGEQKNINWFIFGSIGDEKLASLTQENLIKTGAYRRDEISPLLDKFKIDIVCILPIWHETFCYTLSEALLNGIPVIATDIGAVGERVNKLNCGWSFPLSSTYNDILALLKKISKDKSILFNVKEEIKSLNLRSINEMLLDYKHIYANYLNNENSYFEFDSSLLFQGYILAKSNNNSNARKDNDYLDKINQYEKQIELINSSITFRIVVLFSNMKIPFKKQLKKILSNIFRIVKH